MNRTKLTPLGRVLVLVLILTLGAIAGAAGAAATKPHARAWRCVAVRPGDTLWGLSGSIGGDTRETIDRIVTHNDLEGRPVQVGMAIWVPNEGEADGLLGADPNLCPTAH